MKPVIPEPLIPLDLETVTNIRLVNGLDLRLKRVVSATSAHVSATAVNFETVWLDACEISSCRLKKASMQDVVFNKCLLFGTDFDESGLHRVKFEGGMLSGAVLTGSMIKQVTFSNLKFDLGNFRFSKFTDVVFDSCDLKGSDFLETELKNVVFKNCDLTGVDFSKCKMQSVDLRSAVLTDIKGLSSLKGAKITITQLIGLSRDLAADIGIIVEED